MTAADENTDVEDFDDDEEIEPDWIVSICPVGPELAAQIVGLTTVDTGDPGLIFPAVEALGWSREVEIDHAWFATPAGHQVYIDGRLSIPFLYECSVPTEVASEDFWGQVPGWTSHVDPDARIIADAIEEVVQTFTAVLGRPPEQDGVHGYCRSAAWRVGGGATEAILVVGRTQDNNTYAQTDQALIHVSRWPADRPLPDPHGLMALTFC